MESEEGRENNDPTRALRKRPVPEMVEIGKKTDAHGAVLREGRFVSPIGWRVDLYEQHLKEEHLSKGGTACDIKCAARTMFQVATQQNQRRVRHRMARCFNALLERGHFLQIEYAPRGKGSRGEILSCKLYDKDRASEADIQMAETQVERMEARRDLTQDKADKARALVGIALEDFEDDDGE